MKIKTLCITVVSIIVLIMILGMYKFNYLANLPGYDVDGNPIPKAEILIKDSAIHFKGDINE